MHLLILTAVTAALLAATSSTRAQTNSWTGTNSNDRFDGGNWLAPGVVPNAATPTNINTTMPNATVVETAGAEAGILNISTSGTGMLTIQSGGTLSGVDGSIGGLFAQGTVIVTGASSAWTTGRILLPIGLDGSATLTIANGERVAG